MSVKIKKRDRKNLENIIEESEKDIGWRVFETNDCKLFEIIENDQQIGFYKIRKLSNKNKSLNELTHIWITNKHRKKGYGTFVLNYILNLYGKIAINEPNNDLVDLLLKMGHITKLEDKIFYSDIIFSMDVGQLAFINTDKSHFTNIYYKDHTLFLIFEINGLINAIATDTYKYNNITAPSVFNEIAYKNTEVTLEFEDILNKNPNINNYLSSTYEIIEKNNL